MSVYDERSNETKNTIKQLLTPKQLENSVRVFIPVPPCKEKNNKTEIETQSIVKISFCCAIEDTDKIRIWDANDKRGDQWNESFLRSWMRI